MADEHRDLLTTLTVDIVSAFVANNKVRTEELPGLIASAHATLAALGGKTAAADTVEPEHVPAVTARKSLANRDHIVSMIDGKPYRSLKRHLGAHGLTPDEYRARYKLPATYPMVAPGYSEARRAVAKKLGLGRKPRGEIAADAAAQPGPGAPDDTMPPVKAKPARRTGVEAAPAEAAVAKATRKPRARKSEPAPEQV